ncbi:hypothetical protein SAMN05444166_3467 [Singulisphaera sp. GP187]|uniref:hypothetical protein n=1 Tax=Singulisphaera sp. GP187 TaxID=1882752 RepID=UPI0009273666|nr:hypothetical protein [Singulisphaera sp. GP187]SIO28244.1 hypothetical protein SAMN05444166_3467 [Singulisphaera sp. GP187]
MRLALALIMLAGFVAPAAACLNDRELPQHEREFRSNYGEPTSPTPAPPKSLDLAGFPAHPMLLGTGAALLTGAFFVTMGNRRART